MSSPAPRQRFTAFAVAIAVLVVIPLAVVASDRFTDVPDSNIFHDDIQWMAQADVTRGCNPPANDRFCPDDFVTREQMSAFMHRLARNRVVDAATAQEAEHAATADQADHAATADQADHATTAGDADTLDGKDGADYVETGKAESVSSEMLSNEAGVALGANDSGVIEETLSPIASVSLIAPTDGFVLANADLQLIFDHTVGTGSQATIGLSMSNDSFDQNHQDNAVAIPGDATPGLHIHSPGLTTVFSVPSGEVTIHVLAEGSGDVTFNDATVSALFVPSSYGDVALSGVASATTDPAD